MSDLEVSRASAHNGMRGGANILCGIACIKYDLRISPTFLMSEHPLQLYLALTEWPSAERVARACNILPDISCAMNMPIPPGSLPQTYYTAPLVGRWVRAPSLCRGWNDAKELSSSQEPFLPSSPRDSH